MRMAAKTFIVLIGMFAGLASVSYSQTTTNILDTFNRNGPIADSSPDIADANSVPGSTWTDGGSNWRTTNANNGALIVSGGGKSFTRLNFTPQNGCVYTMSLTLNIKATASDVWGVVGFDDGTTAGGQPFNAHGPWMLVKATGSLE